MLAHSVTAATKNLIYFVNAKISFYAAAAYCSKCNEIKADLNLRFNRIANANSAQIFM